MTENNKTTSRIIKSETEEMDWKDKDKLKDNDLKTFLKVVINNYNEITKKSQIPKKKLSQNQFYRKITLQNYFTKMKRKYKVKNQDKQNSLNNENSNEDLITIINSSKIHSSLPHLLFSRDKLNFPKRKKKKEKEIKVDMFYSKKFKRIRPQKDYFLRNSSTFLSTDWDNKNKNNSVKLRNNYSFNKSSGASVTLNESKKDKKDKSAKKENNGKRKGLESKNSNVTCFLDRKKINDLPIIYPLFLSYNNSYNTLSEKNRVEKILNKFICLKTQVIKDYKNRDRIMREFMIKNGIYDKSYFTDQKLSSFNEYLKKPFKFDPKKTIIDVIKEAVNYKYEKIQNDQNKLKPVNMFINHNIIYANKSLKKIKIILLII